MVKCFFIRGTIGFGEKIFPSNTDMNEEKRYYKIKEFADRIGFDRHALRRWIKQGKLFPLIDEEGKLYYSEEQAEQITQVKCGARINDGQNWIDLSSVKYEKFRDRYNWKQACIEKTAVPFFYNGTEGTIILVDCNNNKLTIEINGKRKTISTGSLTNVHLGKVTGSLNYEYKYSVGERIQKGKTDITIIQQFRAGERNIRSYKYICNRCNQENDVQEWNITNKGCCPVCSGAKTVEGINDIATTDEWMVPYFVDKDLTRKFSHGSNEQPQFVCPDCGRLRKKKMQIQTLYRTHSIGCICGDGYSYPKKFMYSVLEQLLRQRKILLFESEYNKSWTEGRKFDFWVKLRNKRNIIIEMDGNLGHGRNTIGNVSPEETLAIDKWKDQQAKQHGIDVIRINARKSEKEYLKNNITEAIAGLVNLNKIDWGLADRFALSNLVKTVCLFYENNKPITTKQLGDVFHIAQTTANDYIKKGEKNGWCKYDKELYYARKYAYARQEHNEKIAKTIKICQYYQEHAPILAKDIAKHFHLHVATVLGYLKEAEKYGFKAYDYEYGKKVNVEQLKKTSKEHLKRAVVCYTLDNQLYKKYGSITEAARDNNVSLSAIHACCKKRGTSANKKFRYEDDNELVLDGK